MIRSGQPLLSLLSLFFLFSIFIFSTDVCAEPKSAISELLSSFDIVYQTTSISDYGKLHTSSSSYYEIIPHNISDAQSVIQIALDHDIPLRFRGSGHNAAGMTLPDENEILLRTDAFTHYRFEESGTVTIGSAVSMWAIRDFVHETGYQLPVFPDGAGPTLGGYISVGGIGRGAAHYGGFWENVQSVTLITGTGTIVTIDHKDELFPWLFGSNGQFGLIVEAKIKIIPLSSTVKEYPLKKHGAVLDLHKKHVVRNNLASSSRKRIYFFQYLFVPSEKYSKARDDIEKLMTSYSDNISYYPIDELPIKYLNLTAPLIYKNKKDAVALGIRALADFGDGKKRERLIEYGREFREMAVRAGYKIYLQHDARFGTTNYETYYGKDIYQQFLQYKNQLDPKHIFNRGSIFPILLSDPEKTNPVNN